MNAFEQYMQLYEIDPVQLYREAKVRYLTVYNAKKGFPILPENAKKIQDAVFRLTGIPYVGSFVLMEQNSEQSSLIHVEQFPRNQHRLGGQAHS